MSEATGFRDLLRRFGEQHPTKMCYDGDDTPGDFAAWQGRFRAKLAELSGVTSPVEYVEANATRPPPAIELLDSHEEPDHVRQRIRIESPTGFAVPAYVLRPKGTGPDRHPAVLALHGHTEHGKDSVAGVVGAQEKRGHSYFSQREDAGQSPDPELAPSPRERGGQSPDYGRAAARAGFVVLCPDFLGWGERKETGFDFEGQDPCNLKFMAGMMYGLPLLTLMIHDARAALDVLLARDDVDPRRVGAIGNSFGGRMSMWLAAFDARVRFVASSGALNCFRERSLKMSSCGAQFFPGQLQWGDVEDVYGLIAPRPLLIAAGRADPLLPGDYVERMAAVIERAWRAAGAADRLTLLRHDGAHFLPQGPVIGWLADQAAAVAAP